MTGVASVSGDEWLQRAAQSHASYLSSAGQAGHFETQPPDPYFTGRTPCQCIDAARYDHAVVSEVVGSVCAADPASALDELIGVQRAAVSRKMPSAGSG